MNTLINVCRVFYFLAAVTNLFVLISYLINDIVLSKGSVAFWGGFFVYKMITSLSTLNELKTVLKTKGLIK